MKSADAKEWQTALESAATAKTELVVALLPTSDAKLYSLVKDICVVKNAITSQCICSSTISFRGQLDMKKIAPVAGNVLRQIVNKAGYPSFKVQLSLAASGASSSAASSSINVADTMFVGMDVSHEGLAPDVYRPPSASRRGMAGVGWVASTDAGECIQFQSFVAFQPSGTELVLSARELMVKSLNVFKAKRGKFPAAVLIYRDGVADSQVAAFVRKEVQMFYGAFQDVGAPNIKLTVLVVQKRISTRLYTKDSQGTVIAAPVGTVVDRDIVSASIADFYLMPVAAPPGATSMPTRFLVVRDDCNLPADVLRAYIFSLGPSVSAHSLLCREPHDEAHLPVPELDWSSACPSTNDVGSQAVVFGS